MIQSTQLKVLPDDIVPTNYTKMKGSHLRIGHSRLIRPNSYQMQLHHIHTSLQLTPFAASPSNNPKEGSPNSPITYNDHQKVKFPKTMSLMVHKEPLNARTRERAGTPSAARNYARSQNITQYQSTDLPQHVSESGRYLIGEMENQGQSRMSLASFQDNVKGMKLIKKSSKTEQELVGLKLEGTQCKMSLGSARAKVAEKGKVPERQSCQIIQAWYITQQVTKSCLPHDGFQNIIKKIEQVAEKPSTVPSHVIDQKIESCKKLKLKSTSNSKVHQRKQSARIRQHAHINIINMQERSESLQQQPYKRPYCELYNRYIKNLYHNHEIPPSETLNSKETHHNEPYQNFTQFQKELKDIRRIPEGLLSEKKEDKTPIYKKDEKCVQSYQEKKLEQRKNLMKSYTFKKQKSQTKGLAKPPQEGEHRSRGQDFHVQGWNHSQQFERKEVVLMV